MLFGGGGEDVLIAIEVYSVYIRGPPIQQFGYVTDLWVGTTEERPRGRGYRSTEETTTPLFLDGVLFKLKLRDFEVW